MQKAKGKRNIKDTRKLVVKHWIHALMWCIYCCIL